MDIQNLCVPVSVLATTQWVTERARDVQLNPVALTELAQAVERRLQAGIDSLEVAFGTTNDLRKDVNLLFFETAVNFCFWADHSEHRWTITHEGKKLSGWYGLSACFGRAIATGIPMYDARFMADLDIPTARKLLAGEMGSAEIPLLEQRVQNLNEAGIYLLEKYCGQAYHLLEACEFSAPRIAELVARDLTSFQDGAEYDGQWIWLLKRAQILPSDLSQLTTQYPDFAIKDCDQLTAFADYRLPQVFRHYDVFAYSEELSRRIDSFEHLDAASREEIEIRAATIQACEQLKAHLPHHTSANIDLGLWLISQDLRHDLKLKPHHRVLGYFY